MIFFNKNTKHDKQFLELQTRLNYAYWVASDAHHYFENAENNINTYEYGKLVKQFNSSIEMAEDISISSTNLDHDHAQSLKILKKFVLECINELNFSKNVKLRDSESEEINMMNQLQIQENFVEAYLPYLHPNELESYMQQSFLIFSKACNNINELYLSLEFNDSKSFQKGMNKVITEFKLARTMIEKGINDPFVIEGILDECSIMSFNNFSDSDIKKYSNMNFDYMNLWIEFFLAYERSFDEMFNDNQIAEDENVSSLMLDYLQNHYYGLININAIEIHQFMFEKMGIDIPKIEVYSLRLIKSPIDFIQNRRIQ
tara:strand:- start:73 stop:1017 length:945 start_codon:yes stop_codon:yes gene_type:complete